MLTSCADSGESAPPSATVPRGTTATTDPYAVPATIDIPYLNRVFVALEKINGDATRLIVANRSITAEAAKLLQSILTPDEFRILAEGWNDDIDEGLANFKASPGDRVTTATRIIAVRADCVSVEATRDYAAVTINARRGSSLISLSKRAATPPNPTPWVFSEQLLSGTPLCA